MTTANQPVVSFPAQHASQTLMDLVVLALFMGGYQPLRAKHLNSYLPDGFRRKASDLTEVFQEVAVHVRAGTFDTLGTIGGESTRALLVDVASSVIRRAAACMRDINALFERGDSPVLICNSHLWGRFAKDLLCVEAILACTNQPARDEKGKVIYQRDGKLVHLKGIFLLPHIFMTRRPTANEVARGVEPPLGYVDSLEKLVNNTGTDHGNVTAVLTQIRALTRSGGK